MRMTGRWRCLSLALVLACPLAAAGAQVSVHTLESAPTVELARTLLGSDVVPSVASHRLENRPIILASDVPTYGAVRFFMQPVKATQDICRRDTWFIPLKRSATHESGPYASDARVGPTVQLAVTDDCATAPDAAFGWYQSRRPVEDAIEALTYLVAIQRQARQGNALPFEVDCRSTLPGVDPCKEGALQVLRTLPLDRLLSIDFDRGIANGTAGWILSIGPDGPGHAFFRLRLPERPPAKGTLHLTWMPPLPS